MDEPKAVKRDPIAKQIFEVTTDIYNEATQVKMSIGNIAVDLFGDRARNALPENSLKEKEEEIKINGTLLVTLDSLKKIRSILQDAKEALDFLADGN